MNVARHNTKQNVRPTGTSRITRKAAHNLIQHHRNITHPQIIVEYIIEKKTPEEDDTEEGRPKPYNDQQDAIYKTT
jgi:hypothetical protein